MKSFKQFTSTLYHATSEKSAIQILKQNKFADSTSHPKELFDGKLAHDIIGKRNRVSGVSFTRSLKYAKEYLAFDTKGSVIFEVDYNKLKQKYKVRPVNYYASGLHSYVTHKTLKMNRKKSESEEFVKGSIPNMSKYLTRIIISDAKLDRYSKQILSHELAWTKQRGFLNK